MSQDRMQDAGCRKQESMSGYKMQEGVSLVTTPVKRRVNSGFAESRIPNPESMSGFTLIEMIMVIVITGIIGGMVAVFLKAPIQQYMDVSRRAELTDIADTALYHLAGEISTAVPNSLRVAGCGGIPCVEFLPTRDGGRYRAATASGSGDILDFTIGDSSFDIVGSPIVFVAGDYIVVGSTQSDGNPPYDTTAASGVLRATSTTGSLSKATYTATQLPEFARLSSQRFDVVDGAQQAVTYACESVGTNASGNGTGQLRRYWKYGFYTTQAAPPITFQATVPLNATPVQSAILADKVSGCVIDYAVANQRMGLLGVRLTLTSGGESVSLYQEIHVSNVP
ncbi:MAG: type II secretion system protein [Gallionella sp.]|nr:type II secretion system protein [Gallionella sp.]